MQQHVEDGAQDIYVAKVKAEVATLSARGIILAGSAMAQNLFIKGELSQQEAANPKEFFKGEDGRALRASLTTLGYAPEDWQAMSAVFVTGAPLDTQSFCLAIAALCPSTLIACDETAAQCIREAYAQNLKDLPKLEEALLEPGLVVHLLGMRVINLGGFEAALQDAKLKQRMWSYLKKLTPLAQPY